MSYAIESKKRKFERILESLTDGTAPSRTALNTRNNASNTNTTGLNNTDTTKRRRTTPISSVKSKIAAASTVSLTAHYLPSSRLAFLERLESFRQVTKWHIASTSTINAAEWAKRGWTCQDTDTVLCPSCKQRCHVDINLDIPTTANDQEREQAEAEIADNDSTVESTAFAEALIKRYQEMIITSHNEACPWRRRGCDGSIQRIEGLLNMPTALASLEQRYKSMSDDHMDVPVVQTLPASHICKPNDQQLSVFRFEQDQTALNADSMRLAICGWQRKEKDIIECRHCFRSLGLWLYRGATPTMENLDAVDSHLEYCPWRSRLAQATELSSSNETGESHMQKACGWELVFLAIVKKNNKGKTAHSRNTSRHFNGMNDEDIQPQLSPEQREKRMKDLLKRIRDLKKPFNVTALLKRKEKT